MNQKDKDQPLATAKKEEPANLRLAPRCGAHGKRLKKPCRSPAMRNGRCRMHGGKSTGPRTSKGLTRSKRATWKHGLFSTEAIAERKSTNQMIREWKVLEKKMVEII